MKYYKHTYTELYKTLSANFPEERAMDLFVGGEFQNYGYLEECLLKTVGLESHSDLVDVGCGSGRLANRLSNFLTGNYVGTDLVDEVLEFARKKINQTNFSFFKVQECTIPVTDNFADFVTFFSVFTHLYDEDCFQYLKEAKRVVKKNGMIIISFNDFEEPNHWCIFEQSINNPDPNKVPSTFLSKSALHKWCEVLNLNIEAIHPGSERWIPIQDDITFEDGRKLHGTAEFGQSVALIRA